MESLTKARNTSMRSVARLFLNWYEGDPAKVSRIQFVSKLARERLSWGEANIVIEEAYKLIAEGYGE